MTDLLAPLRERYAHWLQLDPQQVLADREEAAADVAFQTLEPGTAGNSIADRLEAEGFGRRTRPTAASVLERLRQRKYEPAKSEATKPDLAKPEPSATTSTPVVNPEPVS